MCDRVWVQVRVDVDVAEVSTWELIDVVCEVIAPSDSEKETWLWAKCVLDSLLKSTRVQVRLFDFSYVIELASW